MKYWIYFVVCGFVFFLRLDDPGITVIDIAVAVGYNFTLLFWFLVKILVRSDKALYNFKLKERGNSNTLTYKYLFDIGDISDKLFILFFVLFALNSLVAVFNGIILMDWVREYMLWSLMLYYFPLKEYFKDIKSINILLTLLAVVLLIIDFKQFYQLSQMIKNVIYAYQIGGSNIRVNQELFIFGVISSIALFFNVSTIKAKLLALLVAIATSGALLSTLSRSYWALAILTTFLLIFFLRWKQVLSLLTIVITTTGIIIFCIYTFFPKHSALLTKFIVKRFQSTVEVGTDESVRSRVLESAVVYDEITTSPIYGHGLRKHFSFQNNIYLVTNRTEWIHNGYMYLSHKAGIPMSILFHLTILLFFIKGVLLSFRMRKVNKVLYCKNIRSSDSSPPTQNYIKEFKIYSALVYSSTLMLMSMFIVNFTTSCFRLRAGLFVTAFALAFIYMGGVEFNRIKNKIQIEK